MNPIVESQKDTPSIIFKTWPIDTDDDEEFRAGYPFTLNESEEANELSQEEKSTNAASSTSYDNNDIQQSNGSFNNDYYNKKAEKDHKSNSFSFCKHELDIKSSKTYNNESDYNKNTHENEVGKKSEQNQFNSYSMVQTYVDNVDSQEINQTSSAPGEDAPIAENYVRKR